MARLHHDKAAARMVERRAEVYKLRTAGMSYPAIAKKMGVSPATIRNDVRKYLEYIPRESAIELRDMELDKLNRMELGLQDKALRGHTQSINAMVRIMQHRAELMGLYKIENNDGLESAKGAMKQIITALTGQDDTNGSDGEDS